VGFCGQIYGKGVSLHAYQSQKKCPEEALIILSDAVILVVDLERSFLAFNFMSLGDKILLNFFFGSSLK